MPDPPTTHPLPIPPHNPREHYRPMRRVLLDAWQTSGMPNARRRLRYLDELLSLRCAGDLLAAGLFPRTAAAKEMTESMAAFHAALHHVPWTNAKDTTTTAIVVGDGATPRTAALFALRTGWEVHSVDPLLKVRWTSSASGYPRPYGIDRLTVHPARAEETAITCSGDVVIVAMHSHASYEACGHVVDLPRRQLVTHIEAHAACVYTVDLREEQHLLGRVAYVCVPCCTPLALAPFKPNELYEDVGILSPDNRVYVWHDLARAQ